MSGSTDSHDGFEFGRWETPFENAGVWIENVVYDPPSLAVRLSVYQTEWHVSESALSPEPTYRVRSRGLERSASLTKAGSSSCGRIPRTKGDPEPALSRFGVTCGPTRALCRLRVPTDGRT